MSKSYVRTLAALAVVLSAASIQALSSPVHAADAATTKAVFWSMDTARKTPFNIEPVKDDTFKDYTINEFFLTSAPIEGVGADKIHVILARPTHPDHPVPLFITFEPFEIFKNDVTYSNIAHLGQRLQCATLFVDNGDRNTKGYSQWVPNAGPMGVDPEPSSNFSYHMIMATRRVIDYVTTLPEIDKTRIGCGGGSFGGWYSMILAGVDDRVGLTNAVFSAGGQYTRKGNHTLYVSTMPIDKRNKYRDYIDPITFAPLLKSSTLMYMGTNDYSFWLDDDMDHYRLLGGEKRIILMPNFSHGTMPCGYPPEYDLVAGEYVFLRGGDNQSDRWPGDQFVSWTRHVWYGEPAYPSVTDPVANGGTYRFKATGPLAIKTAYVYFSFGNPVWPARYWKRIDAVQDGKEWKATLPAELSGLQGCVFATVFDEKSRAASSNLVRRAGADPGVGDAPQWRNGAFWDVEAGAEAWRPPGAGNVRPSGIKSKVEPVGETGIRITPHDWPKFCIVTNSAGLASPFAPRHKGLRVVVDGAGTAGSLRVTLDQRTAAPDEIGYTTMFDYDVHSTTIDIPWSQFVGDGGKIGPVPFDDLRLEGDRPKDTPLTISSIAFYD